jgi:hypothetical protein
MARDIARTVPLPDLLPALMLRPTRQARSRSVSHAQCDERGRIWRVDVQGDAMNAQTFSSTTRLAFGWWAGQFR